MSALAMNHHLMSGFWCSGNSVAGLMPIQTLPGHSGCNMQCG